MALHAASIVIQNLKDELLSSFQNIELNVRIKRVVFDEEYILQVPPIAGVPHNILVFRKNLRFRLDSIQNYCEKSFY